MVLTNSLAGQKGVVMKFKLAYITAGQKYNFEEKIGNFPTFM